VAGTVSDLPRFLRFLDRPDVRELVLQTHSAASVRLGDELRSVTKQPLTPAHLEALLAGTELAPLVPAGDSSGETASVQIDGQAYAVRIARFGERLQIRIARVADRPRPAATGGATLRSADEPAPAAPADAAPRAPGIELDLDGGVADSGLELDTDDAPTGHGVQAAPPAPPAPRRHAPPPPVEVVRSAKPAGPGVDSLSAFIAKARSAGASDVHLLSGGPPQMRLVGELRPQGAPLPDAELRSMLEPLLDDTHRRELEERGYTDLAVDLPEAGRLRVNICRQRTGLKGCFRLLRSTPPTLPELGLPDELSRITQQHQGLVVVSGPSAQGKTTTMGALVNLFNTQKAIHIITVEDPVEILHPVKRAVMSQREVGTHTTSFQRALKAALREDPDVIAIGELRDRDTVEMALAASETGHLVIATMSAPSGARTIDRLIDMFPPDDQAQVRATLAGALKLVISQRLVPSADGTRRVAAAEMITGNVPLWSLIRDNKLYQLTSLLQRGRAYGMIRIEDSLLALLKQGAITEETARAYADDPRSISNATASQPQAPPPAAAPPAADAGRGLRGLFGRKG
jgi:twitching motility protein PilT